MKTSEVIGILVGVAGLGIAGYMAYRATRPAGYSAPMQPAYQAPAYTAPAPQTQTGATVQQIGATAGQVVNAVTQGINLFENLFGGN